MSRTKRVCPRDYTEKPDGKQLYSCRCEYCMSRRKRKHKEKVSEEQIEEYLRGE